MIKHLGKKLTRKDSRVPYMIDGERFTIPTAWSEVTLGEFMQLKKLKPGDSIGLLNILTGLSREVLERADLVDVERKIVPNLRFFEDEKIDLGAIPCPSTITIEGRAYIVPLDIRVKTFGQLVMLEQEVERSIKETGYLVDAMPLALAIYFYPIVTGKPFNGDEAEEFVEVMLKTKVVEAYPVAAFFLTSLQRSKSTGGKS